MFDNFVNYLNSFLDLLQYQYGYFFAVRVKNFILLISGGLLGVIGFMTLSAYSLRGVTEIKQVPHLSALKVKNADGKFEIRVGEHKCMLDIMDTILSIIFLKISPKKLSEERKPRLVLLILISLTIIFTFLAFWSSFDVYTS